MSCTSSVKYEYGVVDIEFLFFDRDRKFVTFNLYLEEQYCGTLKLPLAAVNSFLSKVEVRDFYRAWVLENTCKEE